MRRPCYRRIFAVSPRHKNGPLRPAPACLSSLPTRERAHRKTVSRGRDPFALDATIKKIASDATLRYCECGSAKYSGRIGKVYCLGEDRSGHPKTCQITLAQNPLPRGRRLPRTDWPKMGPSARKSLINSNNKDALCRSKETREMCFCCARSSSNFHSRQPKPIHC